MLVERYTKLLIPLKNHKFCRKSRHHQHIEINLQTKPIVKRIKSFHICIEKNKFQFFSAYYYIQTTQKIHHSQSTEIKLKTHNQMKKKKNK